MKDEQKSPEDLMALRVDGLIRSLVVFAGMVAVIVTSPTALTTVVAVAPIVVTPHVARSHVHHGPARHRDGAIHDCGGTGHHRRQISGCGHHDRRRVEDRQPEREVQRPTRLRRGGEPSDGNRGNQTEEMFCLHERFDEVFRGFFNGQKQWDASGFKSVSEKVSKNE